MSQFIGDRVKLTQIISSFVKQYWSGGFGVFEGFDGDCVFRIVVNSAQIGWVQHGMCIQ